MAVHAAPPWYWRWLGLIVLALAILLLLRVTFDFGKKFSGLDSAQADSEAQRPFTGREKMQQELEALRGQFTQSERQLQMERATYASLVKQVKILIEENATLKEDLAFFQTLMPAGNKEGGVAINRFLVQNEASLGEYRYRLLVTQTGKRAKDFHGNVQFVVSFQQDNKKLAMTLPDEPGEERKGYKLNFRFYQRIEGTFRVAPNAVVKSIQVRVYESGRGEPKLTQTVNLS